MASRHINPDEVQTWLGVLLDAALDPTSHRLDLETGAQALNSGTQGDGQGLRRWTARDGLSELLAVAADLINYPDDFPPQQQARVLAAWCERWMQSRDWQRLGARVRKRRQRARETMKT